MYAKFLVFGLATLASLVGVGIVFASSLSLAPDTAGFTFAASNDDGHQDVISPFIPVDPGDLFLTAKAYDAWGNASSVDPSALQIPGGTRVAYTKDIGKTTAVINSSVQVTVILSGVYPLYYSTVYFAVGNNQSIAGTVSNITIDAPDNNSAYILSQLTGIAVGDTIPPGGQELGYIGIKIQDAAIQSHTYSFTITLKLDQAD